MIRRRGGFRCCALGCDKGTPDIQMNNAVLDISLVPTVFDGTISYGNVGVGFDADVDSNGIGGWIRDAFVDVEGLLRSNITSTVQSALASPRARNLVAARMRSFLAQLGVREVVSLRADERYITLEYRR